MRGSLKTWRESSSIILVAKTAFAPSTKQSDFNYKLLSIKRSSKSGFMPGTYVFPGGALCQADGSRDWFNLYESFGFKYDTFQKLDLKENRPRIFCNDNADELPRFLSLRIGAIRETFEECGILICRSFKINYKERIARWASFVESPEMKRWQHKVHENPENFLNMCRTFEIYPDVWALKEWSNWATPAPMSVRFDTAFFLTAFHQTPAAHVETQEVQQLEELTKQKGPDLEHLRVLETRNFLDEVSVDSLFLAFICFQWATPSEYASRNKLGEILLPPPQFYEISRLRNFLDVDILLKFSSERSTRGVERYFPFRVKTDDGVYTILPGDDLYQVDEESDVVKHLEKLPNSNIRNRIFHKTPYLNFIRVLNFKPKYNHIAPIDDVSSKI